MSLSASEPPAAKFWANAPPAATELIAASLVASTLILGDVPAAAWHQRGVVEVRRGIARDLVFRDCRASRRPRHWSSTGHSAGDARDLRVVVGLNRDAGHHRHHGAIGDVGIQRAADIVLTETEPPRAKLLAFATADGDRHDVGIVVGLDIYGRRINRSAITVDECCNICGDRIERHRGGDRRTSVGDRCVAADSYNRAAIVNLHVHCSRRRYVRTARDLRVDCSGDRIAGVRSSKDSPLAGLGDTQTYRYDRGSETA